MVVMLSIPIHTDIFTDIILAQRRIFCKRMVVLPGKTWYNGGRQK